MNEQTINLLNKEKINPNEAAFYVDRAIQQITTNPNLEDDFPADYSEMMEELFSIRDFFQKLNVISTQEDLDIHKKISNDTIEYPLGAGKSIIITGDDLSGKNEILSRIITHNNAYLHQLESGKDDVFITVMSFHNLLKQVEIGSSSFEKTKYVAVYNIDKLSALQNLISTHRERFVFLVTTSLNLELIKSELDTTEIMIVQAPANVVITP